MDQENITFEKFINELGACTEVTQVLDLLKNPSENFLQDLLAIVDSLNAETNYYEAEKILKVLAAAFNKPEFYSALALAQKKQRKFPEAKANYKKSLSLDPSLYKIYYNYGVLLFEMKEYEGAIEAFVQSEELNPGCELCFYNLGNTYREIEDYEKAKAAYNSVLKINSKYDDAVYNLGVVEEILGNRTQALQHYNSAIELNKNNIQAHWNRSLLLLQDGNFSEGLKEYEWRLYKKEFRRNFPFMFWKGENLSGKKILVYCEQGFGDAIQFLRFIKLLNATHKAVECRKELKTLFESADFIDEVIVRDSKDYSADDFDFVVSIMSLPYLLNIELKEISGAAYIKADKTKTCEWKTRIKSSEKLKIGIVWAGNPQHQNDKYRSINPELLLKNLQNEKAEIYNLQINLNEEAKKVINNYSVIDLTQYINDFSDTAALIENMDLIISVDTSTAHLAGAIGKETWVLLPFNPDWRWFLDAGDSPWYSSVKLFRQKNKDGWDEVLRDVKRFLKQKISANKIQLDTENHITDLEKNYAAIEKFINNNENDKAIKEIEFVLEKDTFPYKAFNYLGILFGKTKNYVKAEEYFLKTLHINPDFTDAISNLGIIYFEQNMFEDSISLHKKSIELNGKNPQSYFNLAYAFQESGSLEEAVKNYEKAIELKPDYASAQFNLALLKLLMGKYSQSWSAYNEWAFKSNNRTIRNINKSQWNGENFNGKKLYVYPDQGMGDVIQLMRYLPLVKERGGEVIFECQPALYDLLKTVKGFDKIVKTNPDLKITEDYDIHIPLQNLPEIFNTSYDTIPNYLSPLKASEDANVKWKNIIGENKNYKAGFVWTGNSYPPINKKRHANLNEFIPLFELTGIDFYSLQLGDETNQLKHYEDKFNVYDFTNEIKNFEDTAAFINNLDFVITIDTSVAHLAGAMEKKVFTLLPFIPDWRWGLNSTSTPWYPSMKLFRQTERGKWGGVINSIAVELKSLIKK